MDQPQSLRTDELLHWVHELRQGRPNEAAPTFQKILLRIESMVRRMASRYPGVARFVENEDIVQNTLVRLLRAMESMRPDSTRHFYALTSELIRRELLDLSKHYFRLSGPGRNLVDVPVGDSPGEYSTLEAADTAEWDLFDNFHELIEKLPTEQREALGLTYYHGWSTAEIGNLFHVSTRTVQRWLDEAKQAIRRFTKCC